MTQTLTELTEAWKQAKQAEKSAANIRLSIELEIYEMTKHQLPDKGTTNLGGGMKVVTAFREDWDQERINAAYQSWPAAVKFPFKGEWKPDGKAIAYLRDNAPDLYAALSPALTLRPAKPAFSVKEE